MTFASLSPDPYTQFQRALIAPALLAEAARRHAPGYAAARPFPHAVIDGLFEDAVLDHVLEQFPEGDESAWMRHDFAEEVKLSYRRRAPWPPFIRYFIDTLNSSVFVEFLEKLTGIDGLIPDPHLDGGGLHQIRAGGKLAIHADFNRNKRLNLERRLNVLIYLNRDWQERYGGQLELWDTGMTACQRRILPVFNRTVVFSTTETSFHGHPEPLTCPADRTRRSVALYYYTQGGAAADEGPGHGTLFRPRPGETFALDRRQRLRRRLPRWLRPLMDRVTGH